MWGRRTKPTGMIKLGLLLLLAGYVIASSALTVLYSADGTPGLTTIQIALAVIGLATSVIGLCTSIVGLLTAIKTRREMTSTESDHDAGGDWRSKDGYN